MTSDNLEHYTSIAKAVSSQDWSSAAEQLKSVPNLTRKPNLLHFLACCYLNMDGHHDAGITLLLKAIKHKSFNPSYFDNCVKMATILANKKKYADALKIIACVCNKNKTNQKLQLLLIDLLIRNKQYQQALQYCKQIKDIYNRYYFSAVCYFFLQDQVRANESASKAFQYQPHHIVRKGESGKVLLVLDGTFSQFVATVGDGISFSNPGGHFDSTILTSAVPKKYGISYFFISPKLLEKQSHWEGLLNEYDVIINAISDCETKASALNILSQLTANIPATKIINPPKYVLGTSREDVFQRCHAIKHAIFPKTQHVKLGDKVNLKFPVLSRPLGSSTGIGLEISQSEEELNSLFEDDEQVRSCCEFYDFINKEGYYQKLRVFFIGGKTLPEHCVSTKDWNVHSSSRLKEMQASAELKALEKSFVEDPKSRLTETHWQALQAIYKEFKLDYMGVDFTLLDADTILVFEANASMRVNPDYVQAFPYLVPTIEAIVKQFTQVIQNKIES